MDVRNILISLTENLQRFLTNMAGKKFNNSLNWDIKAQEVRISDIGIMKLREAIELAASQEMDLVLINDKVETPICRIMNYQKFIYEQEKKAKQKPIDMKEIKVGPNTSENDLEYRIKHICDFLRKGHKVKITMQFSGREIAYVAKGKELVLNMISAVDDYGLVDSPMKLEGKKLFTILRPKPKNQK